MGSDNSTGANYVGRFIVNTNADVKVDNGSGNGPSIAVFGGMVDLQANSILATSSDVEMNSSDGTFRVEGSASANSTVYLDGSLYVNAGTVQIGYGETNTFTEFYLGFNGGDGNFTMLGGTLAMSIKGGPGVYDCDSIRLKGALGIEAAATLAIADQNNVYPDPTEKYRIIDQGSSLGAFGEVINVNAPDIAWVQDDSAYTIQAPAKVSTLLNLQTSADPSTFGQGVTFTATVSAPGNIVPTGSVNFYDGSTLLGTGSLDTTGHATWTTSTLSLGDHAIQAVYSGDRLFTGAGASLIQTVNVSPSQTTLSSSNLNPTVGQAVTFTASVSPAGGGMGFPSGTVSFFDGSTLLGSVTLSASSQASFTTSSLSVGSHTISAVYGGDSTYTGSSASLTETVQSGAGSLDSVMLAESAQSGLPGQAVTFTATVMTTGMNAPTGTVSFYDNGIFLATISLSQGAGGAQAVYGTSSLAMGSHTITATYNGDANDAPCSTWVTYTVVPPA